MANRRFIDFPIAASVGNNDIVLIWQDGLNKQTTKATLLQGSPQSLAGLTDVDISALNNGQILQYNSTTSKWENVDRTDINLSELGDVTIVAPANGQVLVYNSSTGKWENSSGGYVPYTGAITTVDLGAQGLLAGYIGLDTSVAAVPNDQGIIYWDDARSTAALIMNGTLQHIGQDTFFYVKNSTGSSIAKGTAVRFDGTDGASGHLKIAPFLANGTYPSNYFMGVTAEAIANGSFGQVMHFGELTGVNTSGYTAGALLYASTSVAGAFQTTAPVAPNNIVLVAAAINSTNNGTILVRPTYGSNINQDEGVKITSGTTGDLLQLQAGGLWENKTLAQVIGSAYVPSTRTITINGTTQDLSANRTYNVGTVTAVTASSPLFSSGGTTPNITIQQASGSQSGFLSSTDWSTFNSKQNALTNPVTGTGTTNYLPKFTGASTIGNSQVYDSGTGVVIGGAATTNGFLEVIKSGSSIAQFSFGQSTTYRTDFFVDATGNFYIQPQGTTRLTLFSDGNTFIGSSPSNAGFKLDVNGTGRFSGGLSGSGINAVGTTLNNNNAVRFYRAGLVEMAYIGWSNENTNNSTWLFKSSNGNPIGFIADGTNQALTLTTTNNLLVGTTTDAGYKLDVNGTGRFSGTGYSVFQGSAHLQTPSVIGLSVGYNRSGANGETTLVWGAPASGYNFEIASVLSGTITPRLTITNTGAATFSSSLRATEITAAMPSGNGALYINNSSLSNKNWTFIPQTSSSETDLLLFYTGSGAGTRLTITSGGNVGIGVTNPTKKLEVAASVSGQVVNISNERNNSSGDYAIVSLLGSNCSNLNSYHYIASTGGADKFYIYGNGVYATVSDIRLKKNIESVTDKFLQKVMDLNVVNYNWNEQEDGHKKEFGLIAQEVEKSFPFIVNENRPNQKGEIFKNISVSALPYILIKAIQELKQEIDTLKN